MIALAACVKDHWHAVERDLLDLGFTADDIGTNLSICQLISIVLAAPPNTAVHYAQGKWSRGDELLANLSEQQAGVFGINARYSRPGVDSTQQQPSKPLDGVPYGGMPLSSYPMDEFTVKLKERQRKAREEAEK